MDNPRPLVVDLDGTLIRNDLLVVAYLSLIRHRPLSALAPIFWLRQGRAAMKARVAAASRVDYATLRYEPAMLARLRQARKEGRETVLATANDQALAEGVAKELGLFDRVLASRPGHNLKASHKASALVELYGEGGFDYAGNSRADLPVWALCDQAIVVNPDHGVFARIAGRTPPPDLIGPPSPGWLGVFRKLRP